MSVTVGPNAPGLCANDTSVGTVTWSNPNNARVLDGVYAQANGMGAGAISYYLGGEVFGFSLPINAVPIGIQVDLYCMGTGTTTINDSSVSLVLGGSPAGSDKASATAWPVFPVIGTRTYGGAADLWGLSPTYSDINDAGFGIFISAQNAGASMGTAYVDFVSITVTYSIVNQVKQQVIVVRPPQQAYDQVLRPDG
jgi:hypothetical protein